MQPALCFSVCRAGCSRVAEITKHMRNSTCADSRTPAPHFAIPRDTNETGRISPAYVVLHVPRTRCSTKIVEPIVIAHPVIVIYFFREPSKKHKPNESMSEVIHTINGYTKVPVSISPRANSPSARATHGDLTHKSTCQWVVIEKLVEPRLSKHFDILHDELKLCQ